MTWQRAKKYWERCQNPDGSWGYQAADNHTGTGSMTCAGITSLVIASDRVQSSDAKVVGNRIECCLPHNAERRRSRSTAACSGSARTIR